MYFDREKRKKTNKNTRNVVSLLLAGVILLVYIIRLLNLQVSDHEYYLRLSNLQNATPVTIKAARGEILDRYGRPIAVNRESYNIIFDASYISKNNINQTIYTLINLVERHGESFRDKLPLSLKQPFGFEESDDKSSISTLKSRLKLNHYATAKNCFDNMVEKYNLFNYSDINKRKIMGVRYTMEIEDFSISYPFTFAEDISNETRSIILENSSNLSGITIEESVIREYPAGDIMAPLIGTTGPIYAENWEKLKQQGYSFNDYIGKSGAEAAFEGYLRGADGTKKVVLNKNGEVMETFVEKDAVAGNTVMLTIDLNVQKVAQNSLEKLIKNKKGLGQKVTGGAVVVVNVNTGELIASANYPTYTLEQYRTDYNSLLSDPSLPLFNRAINGTYPPGSTLKPGVAAIGITTNNITESELIRCTKYYDYYKDMTYRCMYHHGNINVINALSESCNYYFYETGRRIGINELNKYCRLFGLGVKTGIELPESEGVLAGPAYAKKINATWNPGDTLQASIGQSYNLFTPLQLATYAATIANGGTRYQSHLLHQVNSADFSKTIVEPKVTIESQTGLSEKAIVTAKKGMLSAAFEGTASSIFRRYPIQVGGKTGTSQTIGDDHGIFIAFAPYENSEIAVAIVVEHGLNGHSCAPVVKDIFDAYFFSKNEQAKNQEIDKLLP